MKINKKVLKQQIKKAFTDGVNYIYSEEDKEDYFNHWWKENGRHVEKGIFIPEKKYKSIIDYNFLGNKILEKFKEKYKNNSTKIMFEMMNETFNMQNFNKNNENKNKKS